MLVIDTDSHFEPGPAWLGAYPGLRDRLPHFDTAEVTTKIVAGDILGNVPRDEWPSWEELLPPGIRAIAGQEDKPDDYGYQGSSMHGATDAASRVAWLDGNGIDLESVICLEGMINARFLDDRVLANEVITACNSWLADAVEGYTDRLLPVTCLDFHDVDAAIRELTRMRGRGSRAFLIGTIPVAGVPVMHPQFDPIWSAATDLGMIAILHVGYQPASFDRVWANTAGDMMLLRQLGVSQGHQSVELMLNGMIFGGTFDRHPNLTVMIVECGLYWFAGALEHMDSRDAWKQPEARLYMGDYPFDLSPSEFAGATCASRHCRACTSRPWRCSSGTRSASPSRRTSTTTRARERRPRTTATSSKVSIPESSHGSWARTSPTATPAWVIPSQGDVREESEPQR